MSNKKLRDFDNFVELVSYFDSEQKCVDYLAQLRWNGNPICPYCEHDKVYTLQGKHKRWKCANCHKHFSVRIGTIFEESKISLRKWFIAIYLETSHKKGISSHQLARDLGVTQKTAWFLLHRIREAYKPEQAKATDKVEIDETYVGGKEKNKHQSKRTEGTQGRSTKTKAAVLGILQRKGDVYAQAVPDTKKVTILPVMRDRVEDGSVVYTDEYGAYNSLKKHYEHQRVNHGADIYVVGDAHVNGLENFWSLFKRAIFGIHHHISPEHLNRYLASNSFRYNTRGYSEGQRFDLVLKKSNGRLTYEELISHEQREG